MNKKQDRQNKIISFIEEKKEASASDILSFLSVDIDRKTLQRDLKELEEKFSIFKKGSGRGVVYSLSKSHQILKKIDVEKYFSIPYIEREVKESFNFDIFEIFKQDIFTQEEIEKLNGLHNTFINNFSRYNSQTIINKEFERVMIEFSWKSSEIEGNTYSLLATEALLKENVKGKGKTKKETQMILNHKDAFNEALQNKNRISSLNVSIVEHIHSVLTKDLGINKNLRTGPIGRIGGTKYKPLDNGYQIRESVKKTIDLINNKESFFEKALLSVLFFSYIQAFEDGNKRTARMLSNAILLAYNSIPLSYRIVDVEEYKKAILLFYEINNIFYFKKIFIEQFEDAVKNYFN